MNKYIYMCMCVRVCVCVCGNLLNNTVPIVTAVMTFKIYLEVCDGF